MSVFVKFIYEYEIIQAFFYIIALQWTLEMIEEIKEPKRIIHTNSNACILCF